ncbi:Bromodomain-containing protein, partial [Geranomyces variabilis]
LKACGQMLSELCKHASAWPFKTPVDPVLVGAPDYFDVVKRPMDLSTVERKLASHQYSEVQDFADDVQLMLNNCFLYNPPTNTVHQLGKSLEGYFSLQLNKASAHVRDADLAASSDEEMDQQISTLATCLQTINQQLALLTDKKKPKRKRSSITAPTLPVTPVVKRRKSKSQIVRSPSPEAPMAAASAGRAAAKSRGTAALKKVSATKTISFEQKNELSFMISNLDEYHMSGVVEIIRSGLPHLRDTQEEIELDIDTIDGPTLCTLWDYVKKASRK